MSDRQSGNEEKQAGSVAEGKSYVHFERGGPFGSLRIRNFRFLWIGNILGFAASWIQGMALNWLVYSLTGSGTILGTFNMVRSATTLAMIPATGVLIDRVSHQKLLLIKNIWMFVITLGLGIILLMGRSHTSYLFIFTFLVGMISTLDQTLGPIVIFDLVPRANTPNAVALMQTGGAFTRAFCPAIGGFLLLWFAAGGTFLVQAIAYAAIVIIVFQLRFPPQQPQTVRSSALQNIREGIRYLAGAPVTRTFMLMGFILSLFTIPVVTILPPIYAVKVFHGGAGLLGILLASIGVGGIIGGIVTAYLARLERWGLLQLASVFLLGLSLIAFAFSTEIWMALLLLVAAGMFEAIFLSTNQTLLQLSIPDYLRGRVTSIFSVNAGLGIIGGLLAGIGSDLFGGPKIITIILASSASGLAVLIFLFSATVRNYRLSQGIKSKVI